MLYSAISAVTPIQVRVRWKNSLKSGSKFGVRVKSLPYIHRALGVQLGSEPQSSAIPQLPVCTGPPEHYPHHKDPLTIGVKINCVCLY